MKVGSSNDLYAYETPNGFETEVKSLRTRMKAKSGDIIFPTLEKINNFVIGAKQTSLWNKLKLVWIMAGKWESLPVLLKFPNGHSGEVELVGFQQSDYSEGTGLIPQGNKSQPSEFNYVKYVKTGYNLNTYNTNNYVSAAVYINNAVPTLNGVDIGVGNDDFINNRLLLGATHDGRSIWDSYNQSSRISDFTPVNPKGMYIGSRLNSASNALFKDGVQIAGSSSVVGSQPDAEIYFYGMHDYFLPGTLRFVSESTCEFFMLGDGLTLAEAQALTNLYSVLRTGVRTV